MGLGPDPNGVTLRFLKSPKDKTERRNSITGAHVKFFSTSRAGRISNADRLLTQLGSDDWLTDVLLATSEERLAAMTPTLGDDALTSFSSRHVNIQAIGIDLKTGLLVEVIETDAVTVAPPENTTPQPNGRAFTTVLEVYPSDAPFDPNTPTGIPP